MRMIIAGAGWAGCAAAVCAVKNGAGVILLERTDQILGTGLVGGIMRNNGRYTAAEELRFMGGGELIGITDQCARHENISFPGHSHASLYDVVETPAAVYRYLINMGVNVVFNARVNRADMSNQCITAVADDKGNQYDGDVFLDCTGTAGPVGNCRRFGNGCVMCVLRCPSFGGRISLTGLAGVKESDGERIDGGFGAMSGSCKIIKASLDCGITDRLNRTGVVILPVPSELAKDFSVLKTCQQYALEEYKQNLILLDTGHAKMMAPYFSLEALRRIPGMEKARYEDPYAGGMGNSMRYFAMAPRDDTLRVKGVENLFCAGEKAGPVVGHTEAILTGTLAGFNGVRYLKGREGIVLSRDLVTGDAIGWIREEMEQGTGLRKKYTFSGSVLFERMKRRKTYTTDLDEIMGRVKKAGAYHIFEP